MFETNIKSFQCQLWRSWLLLSTIKRKAKIYILLKNTYSVTIKFKNKKAPSNKPSVNLLDNFFMWYERLSKRVISCPTPVQETRAS